MLNEKNEIGLIFNHLPDKIAFSDRAKFWQKNFSAYRLADFLAADFSVNEFESKIDQTRHFLKNNPAVNFVSIWDENYPEKLRSIAKPPWGIYYIGQLPSPTAKSLAVVGSRRPDRYGVKLITTVIENLHTRPLEIISGLALGIDSLAHFYACEVKIKNFAVLGNGLDRIYPESHTDLARKILALGGGLISEYPPFSKPVQFHFPKRNRIIAALAEVVWVVQATYKSGSKHTVDHALEQNKRIVVCPAEVFNPLSELTNQLLYDGAEFFLSPQELDGLLQK